MNSERNQFTWAHWYSLIFRMNTLETVKKLTTLITFLAGHRHCVQFLCMLLSCFMLRDCLSFVDLDSLSQQAEKHEHNTY